MTAKTSRAANAGTLPNLPAPRGDFPGDHSGSDAQRTRVVGDDFSLNEHIATMLKRSKERDPRVLGRRLATRIPDEHLREALADCLADRVRVEMTRHRMNAFAAPRPGKSRWERHRLSLLDAGMCVNGEWKALRDCTADDLDVIADEHAARAAQELAVENRYREMAARMRAVGATRVADLDASVIEGLAA